MCCCVRPLPVCVLVCVPYPCCVCVLRGVCIPYPPACVCVSTSVCVCVPRPPGTHPDDDVAAGTVEAHLQTRQLVVVLQDLVVLFLFVACQPRLGTLNLLLALLRRLHEVVVHAHQCLVARDHLVDLLKLPEGRRGSGGIGGSGHCTSSRGGGPDSTLRPQLPPSVPLPGREALG